jgi:pimeloyl-ACP methyl ester carboxylesterase
MTPLPRLLAPARLTTLAATALLAACGGGGGGDTPDPLQPYRSQSLQWKACGPEMVGSMRIEAEVLARYGSSLQCAQMRAPMDWSDSAKGDVKVAMLRLASTAPAQRKASLLLNPGGPGGDGLDMALDLGQVFDEARADSPLGAKLKQLRERYDLVGFSPRGLGASTNLECQAAANRKGMPALPAERVEKAIEAADQFAKQLAAACQGSALKPYINSDATARDMDLMRHLLGDEKLHYFGYSYGTWLGAWYAGIFPEKVGRMVLDSVQDFTTNHEDSTRVMSPARERIHSQVMLPYFTRHAADFGFDLGTMPLGQQIEQLRAPLRRELGESLGGDTYATSQMEAYGEKVAAATGLEGVLRSLPEQASLTDIEAALKRHVFHASNAERDADIRRHAKNLAAWISTDSSSSEPITPESSVYWAVGCNDALTIRDMNAWRTSQREDAAAAPLFFSAISHCIDWGMPSVSKPALSKLQSLNALIVQSQYDGATPAEGAARTFAQMPAAKQVYVPGEFSHALFPYASQAGDDPCVDHAVADYLLGSNAAPRSTTCGARAFPLDRLSTKSASAEGSAYRNPAAAQALIDALHANAGPRRPGR